VGAGGAGSHHHTLLYTRCLTGTPHSYSRQYISALSYLPAGSASVSFGSGRFGPGRAGWVVACMHGGGARALPRCSKGKGREDMPGYSSRVELGQGAQRHDTRSHYLMVSEQPAARQLPPTRAPPGRCRC
jgi:hypothetical protein